GAISERPFEGLVGLVEEVAVTGDLGYPTAEMELRVLGEVGLTLDVRVFGADVLTKDGVHLVVGHLEVDPLIAVGLVGYVPVARTGAVPLVRPAHDLNVVGVVLVGALRILGLTCSFEDVLAHLVEGALARHEIVHQLAHPLAGDLLVPEDGLNPVGGDPALGADDVLEDVLPYSLDVLARLGALGQTGNVLVRDVEAEASQEVKSLLKVRIHRSNSDTPRIWSSKRVTTADDERKAREMGRAHVCTP